MVLNRLERRANEHHNLGCERVISLPQYRCGVQKNRKKAHQIYQIKQEWIHGSCDGQSYHQIHMYYKGIDRQSIVNVE